MKFSDNVSLQNEKLISASESGDVMTVVSLLNSGADVQTEDEVHISFSSFVHYGAFFTIAFSCLSMPFWSAIIMWDFLQLILLDVKYSSGLGQ